MIYYRHRTPPHSLSLPIKIGWIKFHATYLPQRLTLNSADLVVTVSETSKHDILKAKLTKKPVEVIYNAPQKLRELIDSDVSTDKTPTNLIYMGSFMEYKNVETLIHGMETLSDYSLHLLSRITPERKVQLEKLIPTGANVIFHNGVSDKQYAELLADRALLVTASYDEGYGIPVAEAATLGVPAVISDIDVFHEVAGEGALYFDPSSPDDFAKQIKLASKPDNYKKLSKASISQSKKFSWDKSAKKLISALQDIA
jgi:glycosyltransferase involved in cell wall biosynthesis